MKAITAEEMKKIDRAAGKDFGIPSIILMENAGRSVAGIALKMFSLEKAKVICVCGRGNNGGDGFVCARHLANKGIEVTVVLIGSKGRLEGDAAINFLILEKMGINIYQLKTSENFLKFKNEIKNANLIIDAIFGIGVRGKIKEPHSGIIEIINESKKKVLAVDVPSGLDADRGIPLGSCVRAEKTVTFAAPKTGLVKNQGPCFCGELIVADISIPRQLLD